MAITTITLTKLKRNFANEMPESTAADSTLGAKINYDGNDGKILVMMENVGSSSEDVTIKAGNSIQGVKDIVFSIGTAVKYGLVLESGKFKVMNGDNKDYVMIDASSNIKISAVELP